MDEPIIVAVLEGTTREKRRSIMVSRWIADFLRKQTNVEVVFVDPKEFTFSGDGNDPEGKDPRYTEIVNRADAYFIVTPEYNHSFPGSLKRMLDSELKAYNHKPVAFAGVSDGNWGGTRAVESLVPAIRETGMVVLSWDVFFPWVQNIFDENGTMKPEFTEKYAKSIQKLADELIWMARLLKRGREELQR